MYCVAIPSLNESDNIRQLTRAIDKASLRLGRQIIIINADNDSEDGTAAVFSSTRTTSQKVSLRTPQKGKGRNVRAIFDYITSNPDISFCMLVDGDVTSFEIDWMSEHFALADKGADYVVPNYSRNMKEGNTTNHFAYPLLSYYVGSMAPRQPIAGDFGLSRKFMTYLSEKQWTDSALEYGVDIFMTTHALFGGFKVVEVELNKKLHKPSFGKMVGMFKEVATSYYETIASIPHQKRSGLPMSSAKCLQLLDAPRITQNDLDDRREAALRILDENSASRVNLSDLNVSHGVGPELWANILADHEVQINKVKPGVIAQSILPYFMLRVVSYLGTNHNARMAESELHLQSQQISEALKKRGL